MKKVIGKRTKSIWVTILFLLALQSIAQEVTQITTGESQFYDSYFEEIIAHEGQAYYLVYINDRVEIRNLDTGNLLYKTAFSLCEDEIVEWAVYKDRIVYASYYGLVVDGWLSGTSDKYTLRTDIEDMEGRSLDLSITEGIVTTRLYPGSSYDLFDLSYLKPIPTSILNIKSTTDRYIYYVGFDSGDRVLERYDRVTEETALVIDNIITTSSIKYSTLLLINKNDSVVQILNQDNQISSHRFDHTRISSAIQLSNGRVVLTHSVPGGTQLTTINTEINNPVYIDTILSDRYIKIVDYNNQDLYVEYSNQSIESIGHIRFPYSDVNVLIDKSEFFLTIYSGENQDKLIIQQYDSGLKRELFVITKQSNNVYKQVFRSSNLFLGDIMTAIPTSSGYKVVVSEETGKVVYVQNDITQKFEAVNYIQNKRGLGTDIQQNDGGFLLAREHALHKQFEYIDPITKELLVHDVDGVIHGQVIPYRGKYFYIRNVNYQHSDDLLFIDLMTFDPISKESTVLEENISYLNDQVSFSNLNNIQSKFGFVFLYNTNIILDLNNGSIVDSAGETYALLRSIYHETENYLYSISNESKRHYRISKNNYNERSEILVDNSSQVIKIDNRSFILIGDEMVYHIDDDVVSTLRVPNSYNPQWTVLLGEELFLWGLNGLNNEIEVYNVKSRNRRFLSTEGFFIDKIGNHIISTLTFDSPYELISTNIETGETFQKESIDFYSSLYKSDSSVYLFNRKNEQIEILSPEWEVLGTIPATLLKNTSWRILSETSTLPVILEIEKPNMEGNYKEKQDYTLGILDPESNSLSSYFSCDDDLRFNKLFNIDSTSTVLLRTIEDGYQVHELIIENFRKTTALINYEENPTSDILIFPNPTSGILKISDQVQSVHVFNLPGQLVASFYNVDELDLSQLTSGVYYLSIIDSKGRTHSNKIQILN